MLYAVLLLGLFVNTVAVKLLPAIERSLLFFHVIGFFAILIPLVVMAPHSSPSFVFSEWFNVSGYADGLSFCVAITASNILFVGYDGACHMGE